MIVMAGVLIWKGIGHLFRVSLQVTCVCSPQWRWAWRSYKTVDSYRFVMGFGFEDQRIALTRVRLPERNRWGYQCREFALLPYVIIQWKMVLGVMRCKNGSYANR
jgi:hypothetical protein